MTADANEFSRNTTKTIQNPVRRRPSPFADLSTICTNPRRVVVQPADDRTISTIARLGRGIAERPASHIPKSQLRLQEKTHVVRSSRALALGHDRLTLDRSHP